MTIYPAHDGEARLGWRKAGAVYHRARSGQPRERAPAGPQRGGRRSAGGRVVAGTAVAVAGTTERGQRIAADYFTVHHGQAKRAGLPRMHKGELPTPEALQAAASPLVFVVVTPRAAS